MDEAGSPRKERVTSYPGDENRSTGSAGYDCDEVRPTRPGDLWCEKRTRAIMMHLGAIVEPTKLAGGARPP